MFLACIPLSIWLDCKSKKKERAKVESDAKEWLYKELQKPPFKIVVTAKNGTAYESKFFKPNYDIEHFFHWTYLTHTSKELAETKIEQSFKASRYFHNETDTYVPICDVETIKVVQAD
jgi:hypothetical protein